MTHQGSPASTAGDPVISTVLLSWNRSFLLRETLESYLATVSVPYELIVIDNGSEDDSLDVIRELCNPPRHRLIALPENEGGAALNRGVALARAPLIHISENDYVYRPGWAEAFIARFEAFPELGQLGLQPCDGEPIVRNGLDIRVVETRNVMSSSIARRDVYENGAYWRAQQGPGRIWRPPTDAHFSTLVREAGYLVACFRHDLIAHIGWSPRAILGDLDYYIERSNHLPDGLHRVETILGRAGYRLEQDGERWRVAPAPRAGQNDPGTP
jgi:glycosyltransferase involved in cell wall biosynthesis